MNTLLSDRPTRAARATVVPLAARSLTKRYPPYDRAVVDGVSLTVGRGEWVAIMGPSGCGKSSLLHMLGGLSDVTSGEVRVAGIDIAHTPESVRAGVRRRHVGYVFQRYNLIDELRIVDDVSLPLRLNGVGHRTARRQATLWLERLGIAERATARPGELSGGEQQRAAIARALIAQPDLILADEPTGALDTATARTVLGVLAGARAQGQTIVMVTHDPAVASAADRTLHMVDGALVERPLR